MLAKKESISHGASAGCRRSDETIERYPFGNDQQ